MEKSDFVKQVERLKSAFREEAFPKERIALLWHRYRNARAAVFASAVDNLILKMPPAREVFALLDERLLSFENASPVGLARMEKEHPVQPNAAELAAKYAPALDAAIKNGLTKELPYNPLERQDEL